MIVDLLYPIKWLLRSRIKRYKKELDLIIERSLSSGVKARQSGMTTHNANIVVRDFWLRIKYEQFIKRWKL